MKDAMKYKSYSHNTINEISQLRHLPKDLLDGIQVVSKVFPFRVNNYVIEQLIDWENIPDDPIFQLTFPQPGMLDSNDYQQIKALLDKGATKKEIQNKVKRIHLALNPHPAGQMELNVPVEEGITLDGMQHKYSETALFFPKQGQTCHAYCTYCFRWPQFVGLDDQKFASSDAEKLVLYLENHPEVTDLLFTGGDPMVMRSKVLRSYIEPILKNRPGNLSTIRIGTKALSYWPYRFFADKDSDDLMKLFDEIAHSKMHLAIMAHFSHYKELETEAVQSAIKRIRDTGAAIRCQAPLIRHVNDDPNIWAKMWQVQVSLGTIPYYMFVERDTGAKQYFEIPLASAFDIFTNAYSKVSGLCRTVRGPSMSATPGKILIDGILTIANEKVFALKFIQGRDAKWVNQLFFARYNENACWINDLEPAFGEKEFFFEKE